MTWPDDVLAEVKALGMKTFTLANIYAREDALAAKHPGNRNVRAKIRQSLQVLRDRGEVRFLGAGKYGVE